MRLDHVRSGAVPPGTITRAAALRCELHKIRIRPPGEGQEVPDESSPGPFCHAAVPAATAVLAWFHLILACSRGGVSISATHYGRAMRRCGVRPVIRAG